MPPKFMPVLGKKSKICHPKIFQILRLFINNKKKLHFKAFNENHISKKREFLNVIQLNRKIFQIYAGFEISCHPKSGINVEHDCMLFIYLNYLFCKI
jgi:hypothetical protein